MSALRAVLLSATSLLAFAAIQPAFAQQAAQPSAGSGQLEEIVVTARKTEEKLQVAPLSVTAITTQKLEAHNVQSAEQLNDLGIPNLNISHGSGYASAANITIRGVNQADNVLTNDAPIAVYVDGVYMARQIGDLFDLVDLERVEVLRGPQGTLFGRNTTGGAINLITRQPGPDFAIDQKLLYASDNEFQSRTVIDTGEIGNTGFRALLAYSHHQSDGWVRNTLVSDDDGYGSLDSNAFYLDLRGDITDELSLEYRVDYTNMHAQPTADQLTYVSPVDAAFFGSSPKFGGAPLIVSPNFRSSLQSYDANPPEHDEIYGHSLTLNYDFSDALRLKSITAYRSLANDGHADQAGQGLLLGPVLGATGVSIQQVHPFLTLCPGDTPVFPSNVCDHQRQYQWSEEFQATGVWNELKYVGGLYFFDEKVHEEDPEFLTIAVPTAGPVGAAVLEGFGVPAAFVPFIQSNPLVVAAGNTLGFNAYPVTNYWSESKSFAAYQQTSYTPDFLDDKAEFTFGLRYTFDQKTIRQRDFQADSPAVFSNFFNGAKNWHNLSWLLSMNYRFTDDIMGYWRIANAYKAGGFSARTHADEYDPETDTSYEIGVKSEFLDHRVRVNADVFYTQYDNAQINVFVEDPVTHAAASVTTNAGGLTYTGGELEASVIPAKNWLIDASFGYTSPDFQTFNSFNPATGRIENFASQAIDNYTSKMTYAIGVEYDFDPFTFGDLSIRADYNFASPKTFHPLTALSPLNEIIKSQNYHTLNAYVQLRNIETDYGTWEVKVFGTNLINEYQRYAGIDFEIVPGISYFGNNTYNRPRVVGGQLTFHFSPASHEEAPVPAAYVPPPPPPPAPKPHSYLVFFDFNKSALTPQGTSIVDDAAKNAEAGNVTHIDVTGHTDTVGSDAYNMRLSKRRAESVAAELEKQGIKSDEIAIIAKGKRDPLVPTGDGVREPQNRRVEIVYGAGGPTS
ncbi:MAG TPA: OmpA family protein [Alphaproteobacteria bacterium]|nr:OmpA family protein [Alphaproteobacteria bacterium]